jgi:Toprim-like/Protein of unknown function (DUF3991)
MINQDCELDAFKRDIDLRQFAESLGYQIDRRESWRGSAVLRCAADKIVVKRNGNGHYVFFSLRDDDDNGTVIDFLQRRQHLSLGGVRQILRPWIGRSANVPQFPPLLPASPDRMRIEREYRRMGEAQRYPYLERDRCVPAALLLSPRFRGRMRIDDRGNTVFPHFDGAGLCGYEIKNRGFTGFAAGGQKGLWSSHTRSVDSHLVLTESAIDALSYATLFPDSKDRTWYASLGGRPSSRQLGLIQAAVIRLADGAEVVAAFDADEAGRWLAAAIGNAIGRVNRQARVHLPATEGDDWNKVLLKSRTGSNSACQTSGR